MKCEKVKVQSKKMSIETREPLSISSDSRLCFRTFRNLAIGLLQLPAGHGSGKPHRK